MFDKTKIWVCARVRNNHELSLRDDLLRKNCVYFIPTKTLLKKCRLSVKESEIPIIPNLVFIYDDWKTIFTLQSLYRNKLNFIRQRDNKILVISDKEMNDFIHIIEEMRDEVEIRNDFLSGDKVIIKSGPLAGIKGILSSVDGKNKFVLRLGFLLSMTIKIPAENLIRLPKKENL